MHKAVSAARPCSAMSTNRDSSSRFKARCIFSFLKVADGACRKSTAAEKTGPAVRQASPQRGPSSPARRPMPPRSPPRRPPSPDSEAERSRQRNLQEVCAMRSLSLSSIKVSSFTHSGYASPLLQLCKPGVWHMSVLSKAQPWCLVIMTAILHLCGPAGCSMY